MQLHQILKKKDKRKKEKVYILVVSLFVLISNTASLICNKCPTLSWNLNCGWLIVPKKHKKFCQKNCQILTDWWYVLYLFSSSNELICRVLIFMQSSLTVPPFWKKKKIKLMLSIYFDMLGRMSLYSFSNNGINSSLYD